jgi:hypothetical protein
MAARTPLRLIHLAPAVLACFPSSAMRRPIRELIEEKRRWHTPPDPEVAKKGFRGLHSRGYLPHFDMPGITQMLNYRLNDAMPVSRRHEWSSLLTINAEFERRAKVEDYLDRGFGNCELRDPRAAAIVEENCFTAMATRTAYSLGS